MKFRCYGAEIMPGVAQGQHEPDAYSAFELDRIQRSKLHGILRPASSPRVILVDMGRGTPQSIECFGQTLSPSSVIRFGYFFSKNI